MTFKQLLCKHNYYKLSGYNNLGWKRCSKCNKEKYFSEDVEFTEFEIGEVKLIKK